ncbi:MAG TPA: glycosyl transferase family 2 [Myxococcales bacterium]|jgi:cellulose synthase/poly-beta-1,6-N-acetylglucosamine synthase-like glycosyltransferase|nr:glycosyl transferase family 2 [Myxococcales bacterium]
MTLVESLLLGVYFLVLAVLSVYGSHRYFMAFLYYRHKYRLPTPKGRLETLPRVTIQLPIFNEMYVCERLIDAVCKMDYPRELLEIQVLDDSTDETREIAREVVDKHRKAGIDIVYLHRADRSGFKAGALEAGLKQAKGEFVAVFDADFLPPPDFLKKTVPYFSDDGVGMVQVRWDHINRDYSLLTQTQSILLDGHFVIEHTARNRSGRFFNFNGTAGIWRRETIQDAGGWQHDTLTEDLDLSYRAQLKGWRFVFLPNVLSPAEIPVDINAFKGQQHRWAKGSIQTARKLLPTILRAKLPFRIKQEAFFHLTNNVAFLLMVVLSLLMPLSMVIRFRHGWYGVLLLDFPFFILATASVCFFYVASQREVGGNWGARMKYLPFLMSLGIGLSVNNAKAVLEALLNQQSGFVRTPKLGVVNKGEKAAATKTKYRGKLNFVPLVEIALGLYLTYSIFFAIENGIWYSLPFLVLFQVGFLYCGVVSVLQARKPRGEMAPAPAA